MGTTTTNGTTTSFGNTPQAGDDSFYGLVTEDSTGVVYLNVMANDLGGNAKTLYSVDNGTTVNTNAAATDLLVKDVVYGSSTTDPTAAIASTNDTSLNGAKIWITSDGKVAYDPATWSAAFYAQVQALPAGQTLTDTFIYAIKLGNGTLSWATATVYISGLNDAATITGVSCGAVTEAGGIANGTPGLPTTGGTVTVHDVDTGQNHFQTVTPASLVGTYGTFTFDANSGVWTYTLDQSKSDSLTAGQVVHDTLTVNSLDGTASQVIDVKITGSNDNATITTSVSEDTSVVEAGGVGNATPGDAHAGGQLTVHDVDNGENHFQAVAPASLVGTYGTFTFDITTGVWTYTLDQSKADPLTAGQHVTDTLTVYSADGTASQTITVNITGSNDSASITASASEDTCVVEAGGVANGTAGDPHAGGTLTVHDVDSGENHFLTPADLAGTYGDFTFNTMTGVWTYTLDQAKADPLTDGQHVTDTLTVYSADGTANQTITVNITGSNDNATITASASEDTLVMEAGGAANADAGDPSAGGQLTVHDVDSGENHFQTPASLAGTYGDFTFNTTTGVWTYTLDQAKADPLTDGQQVTDTLMVYSADGTANQTITVNITGSNDDATITASSAEDTSVKEAGGAANADAGDPSAGGQLTVHDVDSGENHFQTPASLAGTYGDFTFNTTTGVWTYTLDQAKADPLTDGQQVTDTLTVYSADGTANQTITVNITGSNDNATITASASEDTSVVEAGGVNNTSAGDPSAGGQLTVHDVDSGENHFQTPASVAGTYGTFTFDAATGVWSYTLDQTKADSLTGTDQVTDKLTVTSFDGTASQDIVVNIHGSNDNATITASGTEDTSVVEAGGTANATAGDPSAGGQLTVHDVDSGENHFQTPASLAGTYGDFTFNTTTGVWTYTLDQAKADPLTDGQHVTDTLTVYSADGTANQTITVNITGSNDNATITASASEDTSVVENGGVANGTVGDPSAGGTLTVHDVDSGENHFQTPASLAGTYGDFTFNTTTGVWTYTLDQSKADLLTDGQHVTDTLTVYSADGTANQIITVNITGTNDDATITASTSEDTSVVEAGGAANATAGDPSAGGQLTVHDVDSGEAHFQTPASLAGTYGTFTFNATTGVWGYTLDQAKADPLTDGQVVHDTLTVKSFDGTASQVIDVTITGSNDNASISGTATGNVIEAGGIANGTPGAPTTGGTVTVSDVDTGENHFQTPASLAGTYGTFTFNTTSGVWGYTLDQSKADPLTGGQVVHDTLTVKSFDGTATQNIDVTITGSNDAPTITSGTTGTEAENTAIANVVYTATAKDVDTGDTTFTYSLGGTDSGAFNINSATGAVTFKASPDYEAPTDSDKNNVYDITVTATDSHGLSGASQAVHITVTDVAEGTPPTITYIGDKGAIGGADNTVSSQANDAIVSGTAQAGATVTIMFGATTLGTTTADAGGNWSYTLTGATASPTGNIATIGQGTGKTITATTTGGTATSGSFTVDTIGAVAKSSDLNNLWNSGKNVFSVGVTDNVTGATSVHVVDTTATRTGTPFDASLTSGTSVNGTWTHSISTLVSKDSMTLTLTDAAGNVSTATGAAPAGAAGSPINLALLAPTTAAGTPITVTISGVPADWSLNQGTNLGNGTWLVQQADLATLEVTTASTYAGAMLLTVQESWTNADGSGGMAIVADNVEAYGAGAPIYAWSGDDTLTGSAGKDTFVFANPIGNDVIHHFDAGMDQVDLVGFGIADFASLQGHIANDASGNAVITLGDGETITIDGVDASQLTAGNFAFDQEPVLHNDGTLAISDGAMMPVSGIIDNTGVIQLNSTGSETDLEIIQHGATLQGGGQVVLSDDSHNTIYGSTADTLLHNVDNTISGAGNIGGGSLTLVNDGSIIADGTHALTIDTGANHVTNTGTLEATGSGGLVIDSPLDNSGTLWANGGNVTVNGDVSGSGHAQVSGTATLDFGGITQQDINLDSDAIGTLKLDHAESFKGTVSGLDANDVLDLGDVAFGSNTNVSYTANEAGNGGVLSVTDGVHTAQIGLSGQYAAAGFQAGGDHDLGTTITYHPELVTA